jgi:hypothetical protein
VLALGLGDVELAELVVERLTGHEELAPYIVGWNPVLARPLGLAEVALGHVDEGVELLERAAELHRARRMHAYLAEDLAHLSALRPDRADALRGEAETVAARCQAWPTSTTPGIVAQTIRLHGSAGA